MSDQEIRCWHGVWGPGQTSCRECERVIALAERGAFSEPCRCESCTDLVPQLNTEVARLRGIERAARSLMTCVDFWRQAAGLGAAAIPGEYDNLADALASGGDEARCEVCEGAGRCRCAEDFPGATPCPLPCIDCNGTGRGHA